MLIQLRPKAHLAYQSLPILGPIVDEFSDWAHRCGYELKSFSLSDHPKPANGDHFKTGQR